MTAARPLGVSAPGIDVIQGQSNLAEPSLGPAAIIVPKPLGYGVNPNPVTLIEVPQVWGFRSQMWNRFPGGFAGTTEANGSWFQPVSFVHRFETTASGVPCAIHFVFDGAAFEVLFAGTNVNAVIIADGMYLTPKSIRNNWRNGLEGAGLNAYDTYVRFDFGRAAVRQVSLYCYSTLGPSAIAIGANDSLVAWDRSGEPSLCAQTDSYGAAGSTQWPFNAIFFEAAMRLGIPNVDVDAVGGTGYAPNNVVTRPSDSFLGRLPVMSRISSDLFITAGGINDNNWLALPPYATGADARAGFEAATRRYFQELRAAMPDSVLAATGPWQPNQAFYPQSANDKADTTRAALRAVAGPWVFVDNLRGGWESSSGASSAPANAAWQTGTGNVSQPRGDGNADLYVSGDGVHPSAAGSRYLGEQLANSLKAAIASL